MVENAKVLSEARLPRKGRRMNDNDCNRRTFLKEAGLMALAATGALRVTESHAQQQVPWSSGTGLPKLKAPADSCDCHMHIYDAHFPIDPSATLRPKDALVDDYRQLQRRIGTTRNVVVTPSTYGTDNRVTLDAMAKFGTTARGVAVVNAGVTDAELKRLADLGVRGIRFNLVQAGATTVAMIEPLSTRVNALGWHVQIHMLADQIVKIEDLLYKLPSPIVFDHMGRIPQPAGTDHPGFGVIRKLIDKGRTWVKLSGAYQDTRVGSPSYADTSKVAQAYVKAAPERMVWGSDWPHPTEKENEKPNDAVLFDLLTDWAPNEDTRHRILVENPATLYGFSK
jgi:D-galactarolactone isomerase